MADHTFDVLTIGTYEVPIWAKQKWLVPLDNLGADYADTYAQRINALTKDDVLNTRAAAKFAKAMKHGW